MRRTRRVAGGAAPAPSSSRQEVTHRGADGHTKERHGRPSRSRLAPPRALASWEPTEKEEEEEEEKIEAAAVTPPPVVAPLTDEENEKMGWDVALSRITMLQLATCAATGIAEPLLGSIDTFWVATLGTTALAALGPNTCVFGSVIAVIAAQGFGTAATRAIAVKLEEDEVEARKKNDGDASTNPSVPAAPTLTKTGSTMVAVLVTTLGFGLTIMAGLLLAPKWVVTMCGSTATVVDPAAKYLAVRAVGVPAVMLIAVLGGAFQAARDAKTPFSAVVLAGLANLVLDPLCIFTFKMGLGGAAFATVFAQYASALLMAWFAFNGDKRSQFFGGERGRSYGFKPELAVDFVKDVVQQMGRVLNVVAVWGATAVCAARLGVIDGAAHVLLFQIISIVSITAGALTTVGNAICARLSASAGDAAAAGAGLAIAAVGGAVSAAIAVVTWFGRSQLLFLFTTNNDVVEAALIAMPVVVACLTSYYFKAFEGALIGRGDAKAVNAAFTGGGAICAVGLWHYSATGMTLSRVWNCCLAYYVVIAAGLTYRWFTLGKARRDQANVSMPPPPMGAAPAT